MTTAPRGRYPYEDGPALDDPFIRGVLAAFAMVALAIGFAFLLTPLLRFGLSPWWLASFIVIYPIIGLLQTEGKRSGSMSSGSGTASRQRSRMSQDAKDGKLDGV
jgi:fatty acid desaturase